MEVWVGEEPRRPHAELCPCGLDVLVCVLRLLTLLLALDQLCRRSVCCVSMSLLCRVMITGTVVSTGTNCEDVASAGRKLCCYYVFSPSGLIALVMQYGGMSVLFNVERCTDFCFM